MIDWTDSSITEPPVIKTMTDAEFRKFIMMKVTPTLLFPEFSCRTQAVEKLVKLVTEASKAVCGPKSRDGFIHARDASRQLMPTFQTTLKMNLLTSVCSCLFYCLPFTTSII